MSHDYSNSTATYYACIVYVRMECMARKLLRGDDLHRSVFHAGATLDTTL